MARKIAPQRISVPLFHAVVFVFFSKEQWEAHSKEKAAENVYGQCIDTSYGADVLLFEKRHDTIAHEALHAAWSCLERTGVEVDRDNHEALAYVMGYIVAEIYKGYERYEQKTKAAKKQAANGAASKRRAAFYNKQKRPAAE